LHEELARRQQSEQQPAQLPSVDQDDAFIRMLAGEAAEEPPPLPNGLHELASREPTVRRADSRV
jgi:hypothetical protein